MRGENYPAMIFIESAKNIQNLIGSQKSAKVLHFCLCLVLAVLLASVSADLTWKFLGSFMTPGADLELQGWGEAPSVRPATVAAKGSIRRAEELALFGQVVRNEGSAAVGAVDPKDVPVTTLALVLKGVVAAEPMSRALAIVAEKSNKAKEKLYGIGDKVPGNAVISEIYADRIILRRGGVLETLMLYLEEAKGPSPAPKSASLGESEKIVALGDGVHWEIDSDYLSQRLADLPGLAREVGVEVYKEDNRQQGYRLISARGSKLLRDMGLKPGDVLLEVNGKKLDTIQAGLSVYQEMSGAQQIQVVFSRNGRNETRVYEINGAN